MLREYGQGKVTVLLVESERDMPNTVPLSMTGGAEINRSSTGMNAELR